MYILAPFILHKIGFLDSHIGSVWLEIYLLYLYITPFVWYPLWEHIHTHTHTMAESTGRNEEYRKVQKSTHKLPLTNFILILYNTLYETPLNRQNTWSRSGKPEALQHTSDDNSINTTGFQIKYYQIVISLSSNQLSVGH